MKNLLLSMRVSESETYFEERSSIAFDYINFFEQQGFFIYLIPNNTSQLDKYLDLDIDLVVLTGGNNLNPELYNSGSRLKDVYSVRDEIEYKILNFAFIQKIKVIGICRGLHLINVFFGGGLNHNISNHVNKKHRLISNNFLLNDIEVNSFHNHSLSKTNLSKELISIAETKDGSIECAIHKNRNILGIQWHPERQNNPEDKKLLKLFLKDKL